MFRAPSNFDVAAHFQRHQAEFGQLRNMILSEPAITTVGLDHVGDYWLFNGRWMAPGNRFITFRREEMLESVGLSPERHRAYLELLEKTQAYGVSRWTSRGHGRGGRIALFPGNAGSARRPVPVILFSEVPPEPLRSLDKARSSAGPAYARLADGWYAGFSPR
jgi:hypothetical protein